MKSFDNAIIKGFEESWPINLLGKTPSSPTVKVLIEGALWWFGFIEEMRDGFSSREDWDDGNGGLLPYITTTSFSLEFGLGSFFSFAFFSLISGSFSTSSDIAFAGDKPVDCAKITDYYQ